MTDQQKKEMVEAFNAFADSLEGMTPEQKEKRIAQVERYVKILQSMPDEEVKHLSKSGDKLFFDLEAYARGDGTWEKLKMARRIFNSNSPK